MDTKTEKKENLFLRGIRHLMPKAADWLHLVLFFLTLTALDYGFQIFFLHLRVINETDYLMLRLFTPGWALVFTGIAALLPGLLRRCWMVLSGGAFCVLALVHGVYINMYGKFFSFSDMGFAGDGAAFMDTSYLVIRKLLLAGILLCALLFVFCAVLTPKKCRLRPLAGMPMAAAGAMLIFGLCSTVLGADTVLIWDQHTNPSFLYDNFSDDQANMNMLGLYQYTFRDVQNIVTAGGDITDEERAALENWVAGRTHADNEMSGVYEGKNLMLIQLESIDTWMLTEEYMPNLWKLKQDSLSFANHYTPAYITAGTFNTEFMVNTSLVPAQPGLSMGVYTDNTFSNSLASLFADKGYTARSFHGSEAEIYTRGAIHENLGYEKYYAGSDMQMHHYQFDRYLMSGYGAMTEKSPFFSFIITISGHGAYGPHNMIGKEHQAAADAVAKRTEENYRYAVAHAMETDVFIGLLLEQLEADGRLEDTVLIFYADRCNYYLLDNTLLKDIKGVSDLNQADNTDWFIYDGGKTTGTVEKVTSSLDVLPTIANLFGLEADYSAMIGHDAFAPEGGWAFWLDGSWFDGTTWSREVREDIEQQKKMSQLILAGDFYRE